MYCNNSSEDKKIEKTSNQDFLVISLGSNCFPALHTRDHGLRTQSLPLDWNVTPFESLISLIKNDFEDFCELRYLRILDRNTSDATINTKYGCIIHHTLQPIHLDNGPFGLTPLNDEGLAHFEEINKLFERRIKRFIQTMNSGIPIYLLRFEPKGTSHIQAEQLYSLLTEKYPLGNFFLVCLDEYYIEGKNYQNNQNERIFHFYLNPTTSTPLTFSTPDQPNPCFTRVFSELGLLRR